MKNQYSDLEHWPAKPLGDQLTLWAKQYTDQISLVSGVNRLTYLQLDKLSSRLASGFYDRGVRARDIVLVQMPNSIGMIASLFALFRIGACPILAMPGQKSADIDAICQLANPVAWLHPGHFLANDYVSMGNVLKEKFPHMQQWQVDDEKDPDFMMLDYQSNEREFPSPPIESVALLLLSGGSTGTPKLIPRTHSDYYYNAFLAAKVCKLNSDSVYLTSLAVAHNFTLSCPGVLGTLLSGGKVILAQTSGCDELFPLIEKEKVTITALVPPLLNFWLEWKEWDNSDISSLQVIQVGGSKLDKLLAEKVKKDFDCQLQQVFGMAEGLICCTRLDDPDDVILNTQGRPISSHDQVKIVDENGMPVNLGESGELLTKGPYTINSYYNVTIQSEKSFTEDGFYRSGDIVKMTPGGNLIVEGRVKEQINRAGEKISVQEIEILLNEHPDIKSSVVIPVADEILGERICACIESSITLSLSEIRLFLQNKNISDYKLPDQIMQINQWPLTAVGKIDKRKLSEMGCKNIGWLRDSMPVGVESIDVCYNLLDRDWSGFVAYEKKDSWFIGLDCLHEITVYVDRAELKNESSDIKVWAGSDWLTNLTNAIDALPLKSWNAFAVGCFELAGLFHGVTLTKDIHTPLLTIVIPRYLVTLSDGMVSFEALNQDDLKFIENVLRQTNKLAGINAVDDVWIEKIKRQLRDQDGDIYCQKVSSAVSEISSGDYQKVILSRRVIINENIDLLASYYHGRLNNTPARSFAVRMNQHRFIGFSPETIVEVNAQRDVSTQPLAGTRALTKNEEINSRLRSVLINDTKEIAEHAVSVKLAFEEMESVCEPESVRVVDFMNVSLRGSVQHLASRLRGKLSPELTSWHALAALFPAVTASGIPKMSALKAINRYEEKERGAYSGSVMWLDSEGQMDAALILRSLFHLPEGFALQAGAGIIDQSEPDRELEETFEKLQSVGNFIVSRR
ncbi:salicylate synthase [Salmonella enterica subsp. enterica serovar Newport]|nr:salicylate synthase [Salmonella enterica subsp. enterica serovar Newport]